MKAKPVTQKQFKTFQEKQFKSFKTDVNKRFDAIDKKFEAVDKRFDAVLRLIDFKFETFSENMMRWMDDKFVMLDRTARNIEDHRQEQIMIGKCILRFGDQLNDHEKRIHKLEITNFN